MKEKYRLRIDVFFNADDDIDARSFVKSFLEDNEGIKHFGVKKISSHNLENRPGGCHTVHGPWEKDDDKY